MSHNKHCYVKKINKSVAQGSRRVDLMFKQASLKAFTSDFDVCDKDLGIDSVSSATCIESNESVHQPNLSATVSTSACETNPESESSSSSGSQSEDEMPVPDARLFSSGKYERRFTWLYYNVAKGGYCCKLCEIFCPFLPTMQVNRFVSGVLLG